MRDTQHAHTHTKLKQKQQQICIIKVNLKNIIETFDKILNIKNK